MEVWIGLGILLILLALLGVGYYSFYLTAMAKRRSDAELFAVYPGSEAFYEATPKEDHTLTSHDGLKLFAQRYRNEAISDKLVVLVHGYKNSRLASLQYVPMFLKLGYDVVTIDQRSHGLSSGKMATYSNEEQHDLHAWLNYFIDEYREVGLHGHSMGGATVLAVSNREDIDFIISEAGLTSAEQGVLTYVQMRMGLPKWWSQIVIVATNIFTVWLAKFSLYTTNPGRIAQHSQIPILAIHGDSDAVVPVWMSQQLIDNKTTANNELWVIPGGDHKNLYAKNPELYAAKVEQFIIQTKKTK